METRLNRENFLRALESTKAGLAQREIIEQSTCFVFRGGRVYTYNDEASVSGPSGLPKEFEGAVQAAEVLEVLRRWKHEDCRVAAVDGELVVSSKRDHAGFRLMDEVRLPLQAVEEPGKWRPLPEEFGEAVQFVQACAGKDESPSRQVLTHVHLHPKWVEACDDFQVCRWLMQTPVTVPTLVKRSTLDGINTLGVSELSESKGWVHFRNGRGVVLSCRRYVDPYPSEALEQYLNARGNKVALPKGLKEATETAGIFTAQNSDANLIEVTLKAGKVRLHGRGQTGWYQHSAAVEWDGPHICFLVPPAALVDIVTKYNEVELGDTTVCVRGASYTYASILALPPEEGEAPAPAPKKKRQKAEAEAE